MSAAPACPVCSKPAPPGLPTSPFCSPRCKMVDLGRWFTEAYRIPSEEEEPRPEARSEELDADHDR